MSLKHDPPTAKLLSIAGRGLARATEALLIGMAFAGGSAASAQPAPTSRASVAALTGTWRVVALRVADSPVEALVANDPSFMGALLDVTPARLAWRKPHKNSSLSVTCERPRLIGHAIACRAGDFGPPGSRFTRSGKRLTIDWYDGGTLVLQRVR